MRFYFTGSAGAVRLCAGGYTIAAGKETEDREYRPLESIKDNYPRFVVTTDYLLQQRNGIRHVNLMDFMKEGKLFH